MWEPIRKTSSRSLSGNTRPQSSRLTETLWTDPGIKSEISVLELVSTSKKKKKKSAGGECMIKHSPKLLASAEKATSTSISQLSHASTLSCIHQPSRPHRHPVVHTLDRNQSQKKKRRRNQRVIGSDFYSATRRLGILFTASR